ncbi:MAG TPA: polyphosphate kinase 2 family protein [Gemmatimonadales bacterium]|jgi:PPK2 family polyphosphate:nucleotide phosphotransferase
MKPKDIVNAYRVKEGDGFRLSTIDPDDTRGFKSKEQAAAALADGVASLADLQEKLYADNRWAVLLVFQAMDAAGKDSTIKHVMSGVNPLGCQVFSFKAPSQEELDHDFLWRTTQCLPERGRIGVFNRSYYEEVLVVRVHPEFLDKQRLPEGLVTKAIWRERFEDINAFERYLFRNGTLILKFFLHVSREQQRQRFLERLEQPAKNWKFSMVDLDARARWRDYMAAYEDMIRHTATAHAPWHVVPADHKWFTRVVVVQTIIAALERLDLAFPTVSREQQRELKAARTALELEKDRPRR